MKPIQVRSLVLFSLAISASILSGSMFTDLARATSLVELSTSNGSTICPADITGPGALSSTWDSIASTCTIVALSGTSPTICIASSATGCSGAAIDRLIIDAGVTLRMQRTPGSLSVSLLCVYSTLENHGVVEGGSICDYGTIINYGTMDIPMSNFLETLPFLHAGILKNMPGGLFTNEQTVTDSGSIVNNGTFRNRGQFSDDPTYPGNFTNYGVYVGSAPCFFRTGCHSSSGVYNITSTGTTIDNSLNTGVTVTITGASGTNVVVNTQNQTTASPGGIGALNLSLPLFYDVLINGLSAGTARVCVTNKYLNQTSAGGMQYWNGTQWSDAGNQTLSTITGGNQTQTTWVALCGNIPVTALSGTPIGAGRILTGDANRDCKIDISDLALVGAAFGSTPFTPTWNPRADVNLDKLINISDLVIVAAHFGNKCR